MSRSITALLSAVFTLPVFPQAPQPLGLTPFGTPPPPMTNTTVATDAGGSNGVVKLDCNGDGITDLVTSNRAGSLSVFIGNADTTVQPPVRIRPLRADRQASTCS